MTLEHGALESPLLDRVHNAVTLQTHIPWPRIAAKIRQARLEDVLGALGTENVPGEGAQRGGRRDHSDPPEQLRWGKSGGGNPIRSVSYFLLG